MSRRRRLTCNLGATAPVPALPGKNFVIAHRLASDLGNTVDDDAAIAVAR